MKVADYKIYQYYNLGNFGDAMAKKFVYFAYTAPYKKFLKPDENFRNTTFYVDVVDCLSGSIRTEIPVNRLQPLTGTVPKFSDRTVKLIEEKLKVLLK